MQEQLLPRNIICNLIRETFIIKQTIFSRFNHSCWDSHRQTATATRTSSNFNRGEKKN